MKKIQLFIIYLTFLFGEYQYPIGWNELQNENNWQLIKKTKRIKLYSKIINICPIPAYKLELITSVNMNSILETVWDVEQSPKIFPNAYIIEAGIYYKENANSYYAYQLFNIPFLSPRLYQFNSILLKNSIHWVKSDTLNNNYNPNNFLTPIVNFGSWHVEKYKNQTKLTYRVCTNPGGKIPNWIIELANQNYLPKMILDLELFAKNN